MKLFTYFRSTAAYRVRIAFNLKGLEYEPAFIDLADGEQFSPGYRAVNPQALVPALVHGNDTFTQSLAIIEYLDEIHPEPPLLPPSPRGRARVRAIAQLIACDIHPLNNQRVRAFLGDALGADRESVRRWVRHWAGQGLGALESMVAGHPDSGRFCHGETPTLADICLAPQISSAERFACDLSAYPTLMRIYEACMGLEAFEKARPERQPDAE